MTFYQDMTIFSTAKEEFPIVRKTDMEDLFCVATKYLSF